MIKGFIFENFKSFTQTELSIEALTIMIGSNASGKSNAIEGIKILSEIATGRDFSIILNGSKNMESGIRGGSQGCPAFGTDYFTLGCVVGFSDEEDLEYKIKIRVADRVYVEEESLSAKTIAGNRDIVFETVNADREGDYIFKLYSNSMDGVLSTITSRFMPYYSVLSQIVGTLGQMEKHACKRLQYITDVLRNIFFLDPVPQNMREYVPIKDADLRPQADNISAALYKLTKDEENKKLVLDIIARLPENEILSIDFIETPIGDVMLGLREKYGKASQLIEAKRLSDGTLRCIAVITALMTQKPGAMVIIEEVDNGIHPSRAKSLINAIAQICRQRKIDVIITTHNTALLNAVEKENLVGVSICYREADGGSKFIQLLEIEKYPGLMAKGKLGDLTVDDEILKAIKSPKKEYASLKWLED